MFTEAYVAALQHYRYVAWVPLDVLFLGFDCRCIFGFDCLCIFGF